MNNNKTLPVKAHLIGYIVLSLLLLTGCQQPLTKPSSMKISSPNFANNELIPQKFTCQGQDISPELQIADIPEDTKSLALIMEDPDAPMGTWNHWVMWNIDPQTKVIPENSVPPKAVQGNNSWPKAAYGGPCPPSGAHRYFFKLYALKTTLDLPAGSTKEQLLQAMEGQIIEEAQLLGIYRKTGGKQ
jgi:hypothetical protein